MHRLPNFRVAARQFGLLLDAHLPKTLLLRTMVYLFSKRIFSRKTSDIPTNLYTSQMRLSTSADWFHKNIPFLFEVLSSWSPREDSKAEILEIGSWEGASATFFLEMYPESTIVCVDTWAGSEENWKTLGHDSSIYQEVERRFDENMSPHRHRVSKEKKTSAQFFSALPELKYFDLVFLDGSHLAEDLLLDAINAHRHLHNGGLLVFDDFLWTGYVNSRCNPISAIAAFLFVFRDMYEVVGVAELLVLRKKEIKSILR